MICPKCKNEVPRMKFCGECGHPLLAVCKECGKWELVGRRICGTTLQQAKVTENNYLNKYIPNTIILIISLVLFVVGMAASIVTENGIFAGYSLSVILPVMIFFVLYMTIHSLLIKPKLEKKFPIKFPHESEIIRLAEEEAEKKP